MKHPFWDMPFCLITGKLGNYQFRIFLVMIKDTYFEYHGLRLVSHYIPVNIYMLKVINRNSRRSCEICSKLAITHYLHSIGADVSSLAVSRNKALASGFHWRCSGNLTNLKAFQALIWLILDCWSYSCCRYLWAFLFTIYRYSWDKNMCLSLLSVIITWRRILFLPLTLSYENL